MGFGVGFFDGVGVSVTVGLGVIEGVIDAIMGVGMGSTGLGTGSNKPKKCSTAAKKYSMYTLTGQVRNVFPEGRIFLVNIPYCYCI